VYLVFQGSNYAASDTLSASNSNLGGTGSGFSIPVSTVGAYITDIDIDLHLSDVTLSSVTYPVQFRSYTPGGVLQNPTNDVFDRISLRGNFARWPWVVNVNPINVASVPNVVGRLAIDPSMFDAFVQNQPQVYPGFLLKLSANMYLYTKTGDLTAAAVFVDLSKYDPKNLFAIRFRIYAKADWTTSSTNQSYYEYILLGNRASATTTISSTTTIASSTSGTASVVSFAASGTGINVSFTNYNGANAELQMYVEYQSKIL